MSRTAYLVCAAILLILAYAVTAAKNTAETATLVAEAYFSMYEAWIFAGVGIVLAVLGLTAPQ